jgi:hypothetical protein
MVETPPDAPFKMHDVVECIETFEPQFDTDYVPQRVGERFVVQAYLATHDYLILRDTTCGYVNASRFRKVPDTEINDLGQTPYQAWEFDRICRDHDHYITLQDNGETSAN